MASADGSVCPPGYGHHEFNGIDNCTAPGSVNGQYPWEAWRDYGRPQGDPQPGPEAEQPQPQQQPVGGPQPGPEAEQPQGDPQPGNSQPQQRGVEAQPEGQPHEGPAIVEVPQPVEVPERREPREPQAQQNVPQTGGGCTAAVVIYYRDADHVGYYGTTGCVDESIVAAIDQIQVDGFEDGIANGWVDVAWRRNMDHLGQLPEVECTPKWVQTRGGEEADRYATGGNTCVVR